MENWFDSDQMLARCQQLAPQLNQKPLEQASTTDSLTLSSGPILRLTGSHELNRGANYRGSLLLSTTDSSIAPTISYQLGPAVSPASSTSNLELQKGTFQGQLLATEQSHHFFRYLYEFQLAPFEQKCRYFIKGITRPFEFILPAADQSMNAMFYSCNGFSYKSDATKYSSQLWWDVLRSHYQSSHYHVLIGGGDQIYSDVIKRDTPALSKWLATQDHQARTEVEESEDYMAQLDSFYLKHYLNWYGKGFMDGTTEDCYLRLFPEAIATIPSVNTFDDHDIIDGFGSYGPEINNTAMFTGLGKMAMKYYLLFQHHTSLDEVSTSESAVITSKREPSWIMGAPNSGGYMVHNPSMSVYTRLGKKIGLVGIDCRSERTLEQIVSPKTNDLIFQRLQEELAASPEINHLYVLLGVPILYPRLVLLESILNSPITKGLTSQLRKRNIGNSVIQEFDGGVDIVDDMNDHWCSAAHKAERNKFVARLQSLAHKFNVRITFLGGDVHLAAMGRIRSSRHVDKETHQLFPKHNHTKKVSDIEPVQDPRLMFNVVSSAIINHPPPDKVAQMMFNVQKKHYFGKEAFEDMVPLFKLETDGKIRENEAKFKHHNVEFMNKRNYSDLIPVENLPVYHEYVGQVKYPGPVDKVTKKPLFENPVGENAKDYKYHYDLGYPVELEGIVTTIHVEKDITDPNARTQDYELMIPPLKGESREPLKQTSVKHLH